MEKMQALCAWAMLAHCAER